MPVSPLSHETSFLEIKLKGCRPATNSPTTIIPSAMRRTGLVKSEVVEGGKESLRRDSPWPLRKSMLMLSGRLVGISGHFARLRIYMTTPIQRFASESANSVPVMFFNSIVQQLFLRCCKQHGQHPSSHKQCVHVL